MLNQQEIKNLIKSGYDLELIAFEFDLDIKLLEHIKKELENPYKISQRTVKQSSYSSMESLRERYNKLYYGQNNSKLDEPELLTPKQQRLVETVISFIEEKIKELSTIPANKKIPVVHSILTELIKVENFKLSVEYSQKLYNLISSEELKKVYPTMPSDKTILYLNSHRKRMAVMYSNAIDRKQSTVTSLEELEELYKLITPELSKDTIAMIGSGVKDKIFRRITEIKQQQAIDKVKNNVPPNIKSIVKDLLNGTIDIQHAQKVIQKEAKKRFDKKPKNAFTLTEEQEKNSILTQIRTIIVERAEKNPIKNPEELISQLHELCGGNIEQSIRTVVHCLIARKDFEKAKDICENYSPKTQTGSDASIARSIRTLRNDIKHAEIGDLVLRGIKRNGTPDEDAAYFTLIEKGLREGNIRLDLISLGKNSDGTKTITLADIWTAENEKRKLTLDDDD